MKGVVIWPEGTYPISSTVVAKGLCQQDRKKEAKIAPTCLWEGYWFL